MRVREAWKRHEGHCTATYRLGRERVGVILLVVIIDRRLGVRVHSERLYEGLEAQARSCKGLRRLV